MEDHTLEIWHIFAGLQNSIGKESQGKIKKKIKVLNVWNNRLNKLSTIKYAPIPV